MNLGFVLIGKGFRKICDVFSVCKARLLDRLMREKLPCYCPCCDTYLKRFVDGGYNRHPETYNPECYAGMDQEVICPICRSLPRHRILVSWMNQSVAEIKEKRILHFAQEKALRIWMNRNQIISVTADLYHVADLRLNIENTELEENSYDLIICNHVLEHVSNYSRALAELHRIICPGGMVIISFPTDLCAETVYEADENMSEQERIYHFGQRDHMRVFGIDSPNLLKGFGFDVTEIRGDHCDKRIKPIIGPANYDYNVLWILSK